MKKIFAGIIGLFFISQALVASALFWLPLCGLGILVIGGCDCRSTNVPNVPVTPPLNNDSEACQAACQNNNDPTCEANCLETRARVQACQNQQSGE